MGASNVHEGFARMSENQPTDPVETLSLSREEQWTLHHVLLDRLRRASDAGATATDLEPVAADGDLRGAFETLDGGECRFTLVELEAIQDVLAAYHHSTTWWEIERPRLERLLHGVSMAIERGRGSCRADDRGPT